MDEKYLLPLAGVFLGWLLSTLAAGWQARRVDKRSLGRLLTKLIRLHTQVKVLQSACENLKDGAGSWQTYERIRKYLMRSHFSGAFSDDLYAALNEISGSHPTDAIRLRGIVDVLVKIQSARLDESVKIESVYLNFLSVYEVGLDASESALRKEVLWIAYKHSIQTFFKVFAEQRKSARRLTDTAKFADTLTAEAFAILKEKDVTSADGEAVTHGPNR
jgi:hypothetical protein